MMVTGQLNNNAKVCLKIKPGEWVSPLSPSLLGLFTICHHAIYIGFFVVVGLGYKKSGN